MLGFFPFKVAKEVFAILAKCPNVVEAKFSSVNIGKTQRVGR
jgi:hypothetical protein